MRGERKGGRWGRVLDGMVGRVREVDVEEREEGRE